VAGGAEEGCGMIRGDVTPAETVFFIVGMTLLAGGAMWEMER
jgi:hypothetical protein